MFKHEWYDVPQIERIDSDAGRKYKVPSGALYPSITTVLGAQPKPQLEAWRKRIGAVEAAEITVNAANRGTLFHAAAEKYFNNDPTWKDTNTQTLRIINGLRMHFNQMVDTVYRQEVGLFCDRLKFAGTADMIGRKGNITKLIDFKSSKKLKLEKYITDYFIQTTFYALCWKQLTGISIDEIEIVIGIENGLHQTFKCSAEQYIPELEKFAADWEKKWEEPKSLPSS
jgi:predicted RecB family nuclease